LQNNFEKWYKFSKTEQYTKNKSNKKFYTKKNCMKNKPVKISLNQDSQEYKFIWSKWACAFLSAYEARDIEADNTKKEKILAM